MPRRKLGLASLMPLNSFAKTLALTLGKSPQLARDPSERTAMKAIADDAYGNVLEHLGSANLPRLAQQTEKLGLAELN